MSTFKIAAAQVAAIRGDIDRNIATHAAAIAAAAERDVSVLVFPELSLTGYEIDLSAELAMSATDPRLNPLRDLARKFQIEVIVGAPLRNGSEKPWLGAIVMSADGTTKTYSKMHLGGSEPIHFTQGEDPLVLTVRGYTTGIAICADASQPSHPLTYAQAGTRIYAAGVFLNSEWYVTDAPRLANYAARHRMLVLMANHADSVGTYRSVGKSAAWAPDGQLLAQADGVENSLVIATHDGTEWHGGVIRI